MHAGLDAGLDAGLAGLKIVAKGAPEDTAAILAGDSVAACG